MEPPLLGEVVDPLLCRLERVEGTCDCCLFEWLVRGRMVSDDPEEPEDIDGDEPDVVPVEDCANAVPATNRAAAAVTINVRIEDPFEWLVWALYERFIPTCFVLLCSATIDRNRAPAARVDFQGDCGCGVGAQARDSPTWTSSFIS